MNAPNDGWLATAWPFVHMPVIVVAVRRHPRHARRRAQPVPKRSSSLALSGGEDRLLRPAARRNIAEKAQNCRIVLLHKMGDSFSAQLWPQLVSEIDRHAL